MDSVVRAGSISGRITSRRPQTPRGHALAPVLPTRRQAREEFDA
jgi:hypothetical protein